MALTISEIAKQVAIDVGLEEPSGTIFSSTDKDIKQILHFMVMTGRELRNKYLWPQLKKTYTFTTSASDTQYVLPGDFWKMISGTHWDQTHSWAIGGPMSDQIKNAFLHGVVSSLNRKRFYVFGSDYTSGQFFLDPAPSATETLSFDYIRAPWFMPKAWAASESVTSGSTYRFSSGNLYLAQTTNTTGSTAPSHTTGTASDGVVTWLYVVGQTYTTTDRFLADTDFPLIDEDLIIMGAVWRMLKRKGFDYEEEKVAYYREAASRATRLTGAQTISMADNGLNQLLTSDNVPEGSWG